jgi:hypothetical protein
VPPPAHKIDAFLKHEAKTASPTATPRRGDGRGRRTARPDGVEETEIPARSLGWAGATMPSASARRHRRDHARRCRQGNQGPRGRQKATTLGRKSTKDAKSTKDPKSAKESKETKGGGGTRYVLDQDPQVEGAMVVIDPYTGQVKAVVGGYSFERSQFDRATQGRRQPGSAIKPLLYPPPSTAATAPIPRARRAHLVSGRPGRQALVAEEFGRSL